MSDFLFLVVSGLVSGAIYALLAAGITLLYSTTGIFNFAHGAIAASAAIVHYQLVLGFHWHPWVSFAFVSFVLSPLLGLALEALIFRHLARASESARLVGTIGLVIALPNIVLWLVERAQTTLHWQLANLQFAARIPSIGPQVDKPFKLPFDVTITSNQVIVLVVSLITTAALWAVLTLTPLGLQMRAVVDRRDLAAARGVDPAFTSKIAWMLGTMLAGLAGVVGGTIFGINSLTYTQFLIAASVAVVFARFRSLVIAVAGGLILGALVNLGAGYLDVGFIKKVPGLASSGQYVVLFIALYFFGRARVRSAGVTAAEPPPSDYLADLSPWQRRRPWIIAGAGLVVWVLGLIPISNLQAGPAERSLVATGLATGVIFLSFTVVTGMGGIVSLAQAAFVTSGGLVTGYLVEHHHWPLIPGALLGALITAGLAGVVALPALRLGGLALALASLALALLGDAILFKLDFIRNLSLGWTIPRSGVGPVKLTDMKWYCVFLLVIALLMCWLVSNLQRSLTGRAMTAVRSAESAAAASGISPALTKLVLFAISGFVAAIGGVLLVLVTERVSNTSFPPLTGLFWLTVTVTFGVRRPGAAVLAGLVSSLFPQVIKQGLLFIPGTAAPQIPLILAGMGAIQLAKNPNGIVSMVAEQRFLKRKAKLEVLEPEATAASHIGDRRDAASVENRAAHVESADTSAALSVRGLRSGYGDVEVLRGIDLDVPAQSIVALLGSNGAGKSTFCSTIAGLVPATSGVIFTAGVDVTASPAHVRARNGVLLAPESRGIFPSLSVDDNLDLWLTTNEQKDAVFSRYPVLGQRRRLPAGNLSGGEQQMLTLAPLLARPPSLLIADEPTLGLAPLVVEELLQLFTDLRAAGTSLLIVEEKARNVLKIADRVAFIALGNIVWSGPRSEVDEEAMAERYLGAAHV